jgi:predicted choloylglycine hydrolase
LQHWETLVAAQFRSTKDQKEISAQTENLKKMKEVREMIDELEKELFNSRHGDLGNIVTQKTFFKDTPVEDSAKKRTASKKGPRARASEPYE